MKKEIPLKPPCQEYDVQGIESWLQYQSLVGNQLFDTAGRTFFFQEGEPKKLVFRLEPMGKKRIEEEQKEAWRTEGWIYAASYRRLYDIFFSETEERDEMEALASSQSAGLRFLDQRFGGLRFWGILLLAGAAFLCWMAWQEEIGLLCSFFYGTGFFAVSLFSAYLIFWIIVLAMGVWLRKQTKALKEGRPMPEEDYRRAMRKGGKFLKFLEVFWSVSTLLLLVMNFSGSSGSLKDMNAHSDFLSLAKMEGECYTPELDRGGIVGQHYLSRRNPLVKKNLRVKQSGYKFQTQEELKQYAEASKSDEIAPVREKVQAQAAKAGIPAEMKLYLYETRQEEDAQKLLDQACEKYMGISQRANLYQKGIYGFDDVSVIDRGGNRQIVCARGGNTAIILFYEGDLDMNDQLEYISNSVMAGADSWIEELSQ